MNPSVAFLGYIVIGGVQIDLEKNRGNEVLVGSDQMMIIKESLL